MTEKNPPSRHLGYARVSTYGQTLGAQLEQLRNEGRDPQGTGEKLQRGQGDDFKAGVVICTYTGVLKWGYDWHTLVTGVLVLIAAYG
jgi:hypothetical protein